MRKLTPIIFIVGISLAGCASNISVPIISNKQVVVLPPESLYFCPIVKLPKKRLTNLDVSYTIIQYENANGNCRSYLNSIHSYLNKAAAKYNSNK